MLSVRAPLFSIITVVYNGADFLQGTINSVSAQTFTNFEYIVIDGKSKDTTVDIIQKNEKHIAFWLSEPDNGLYDAMNKGLVHAKGDFVFFLNCGDHFFSSETLAHVAAHISSETDIIYGDTMYVDAARTHLGTRAQFTPHVLPKKLTAKSFKYGMSVSHQGIFVRRTIAKNYIAKNLAADIDWVITVLKQSRQNVNANIIVSEFLIGGISKQKHRQSLVDRYHVLKKHYGFLPNLFHHAVIVLRAALKRR